MKIALQLNSDNLRNFNPVQDLNLCWENLMAVLNLYSKTWIIRLLDHQFAISMLISHQSSLPRSPIQPDFYLPPLLYFLFRYFRIFFIGTFKFSPAVLQYLWLHPWQLSKQVRFLSNKSWPSFFAILSWAHLHRFPQIDPLFLQFSWYFIFQFLSIFSSSILGFPKCVLHRFLQIDPLFPGVT